MHLFESYAKSVITSPRGIHFIWPAFAEAALRYTEERGIGGHTLWLSLQTRKVVVSA